MKAISQAKTKSGNKLISVGHLYASNLLTSEKAVATPVKTYGTTSIAVTIQDMLNGALVIGVTGAVTFTFPTPPEIYFALADQGVALTEIRVYRTGFSGLQGAHTLTGQNNATSQLLVGISITTSLRNTSVTASTVANKMCSLRIFAESPSLTKISFQQNQT